MKQILFPLLLSILPLTACSSASETEIHTQSSTTGADAELSLDSQKIINEYNQILIQSQNEPDPKLPIKSSRKFFLRSLKLIQRKNEIIFHLTSI